MCEFDGPEGANHDICGSYNSLRQQNKAQTSNHKTQTTIANYSGTNVFADYNMKR